MPSSKEHAVTIRNKSKTASASSRLTSPALSPGPPAPAWAALGLQTRAAPAAASRARAARIQGHQALQSAPGTAKAQQQMMRWAERATMRVCGSTQRHTGAPWRRHPAAAAVQVGSGKADGHAFCSLLVKADRPHLRHAGVRQLGRPLGGPLVGRQRRARRKQPEQPVGQARAVAAHLLLHPLLLADAGGD